MEKSTTYTIRVPEELKLAFEEATKANDRRGSQMVRDFMRQYVRGHEENLRKQQARAKK
jgi:predicted transcriptional regulator